MKVKSLLYHLIQATDSNEYYVHIYLVLIRIGLDTVYSTFVKYTTRVMICGISVQSRNYHNF